MFVVPAEGAPYPTPLSDREILKDPPELKLTDRLLRKVPLAVGLNRPTIVHDWPAAKLLVQLPPVPGKAPPAKANGALRPYPQMLLAVPLPELVSTKE